MLTENVLAVEMKKNTNINEEVCLFKLFKNNDDECKKANRTKKCVTKGNLKRL